MATTPDPTIVLFDRIIENSIKLTEQTVEKSKPGFLNLLTSFDKWLEAKLVK